MTETELLIRNQLGLHARACALFVKTAARFKSNILVSRDDLEVNGKSIMGVMMLAAEEGSTIRVRAEGAEVAEAVDRIDRLPFRARQRGRQREVIAVDAAEDGDAREVRHRALRSTDWSRAPRTGSR